jgi:2-haloacid dehalogenase
VSTAAFDNIEACVFDAYGTLFDVHSAARRMSEKLGEKEAPLSALWRSKQLEYTWLRSLMGHHADFRTVTGDALDYALAAHGMEGEGSLRERLMDAYLRLDAYPETAAALAALKRGGKTTAILSNGSPDMLAAALKSSGLAPLIDQCLSVEEVGIYKPDPRVYRLAVERLGIPAERISFESSNPWDTVGAKLFGFNVVWINRFGLARERLPASPDAELTSLEELPRLLGL